MMYFFFQVRVKLFMSFMYHGTWKNAAETEKRAPQLSQLQWMRAEKLLLNSGLSRSGTWSHLLFILGNTLNCLYSWTNKTQIPTSILGEKWEVIWEENELFVNYYILLDSELWLCKCFLHFLVLVRDCFLTPLSNNNK